MLSALASVVLVSEICSSFTYAIDVYISEYVVFKMRHATAFNKFTVNSAGLSIMILFSGHTIIQNAIGKRNKCSLSLNRENQPMKRVLKILHSTTLLFGQTHELASCWTDM